MNQDTASQAMEPADLRRRRVLRTATAYALVSWVLLQLGEITFEPLKLPPVTLTVLIWVLVLGFPVAVIVAWLFENRQGRPRLVPGTGIGKTLGVVVAVLALDAVAARWLYHYYLDDRVAPVTAAAPAQPDPALTDPPGRSIAVLPFVDLSEAGNQQYFSDGISEEILNLLARVDGLEVVSRTSSFAFRDERDVREIGRLLNVATVLEGSIRKAGESVRVTAQLIDARNGFHLWTNHYDRRLEDILMIQEDIASEIVNELLGQYPGLDREQPPSARVASFEAYDLYLQGRELWQRRTVDSLTQAVAVFERVLELDPSYALAYAGLADSHLLLAEYGNLGIAEAVQRAGPLIQTALELDGQLSEGFASLGLMYWQVGRFAAAETHLRRALRLDPDNLTATMWLGTLVGQQGRLAEERLILNQARDKDPLNPLIAINLAGNHLRSGEKEAGLALLRQILAIYPTSTAVLRTLARANAEYGDLAEGLALADRALTVAPDEPPNHALAVDLALVSGDLESASLALAAAMEVGPQNDQVTSARARYLLRTGQHGELQRLALAYRESQGEAVLASQEAAMPDYWMAWAALMAGDLDTARDHLQQVLDDVEVLDPTFAAEALTLAAATHRLRGDQAAAEAELDGAAQRLSALRLQGMADPDIAYLEACLKALRADVDGALQQLTAFGDTGTVDLWQVTHDPRLHVLRGEPRFEAWVEEQRRHNQQQLEAAGQRLSAR